jgi:hypothetical protein
MNYLLSLLSLLAGPTTTGPDTLQPQVIEKPAIEETAPDQVPVPLPPSCPRDLGSADMAKEAALTCELRQSKRGNEHVVVAIVRAAAPMTGTFELKLDKKDSKKNTVRSIQDGTFVIQAAETQTLADASFNIGHGDRLEGRLEVRDPQGKLTTRCGL